MLTDEEKEAIEKLSGKKNETTWDDTIRQIKKEEIKDVVVTRQKYITAVLKLIEKQSKEIEELNKEYERVRAGRNWLSEHISAQIATPELFNRIVEENYISKDKIKAKIEELDEEIKVKREIAKNPMDRVSGRLLTDSIVELEKTKKVLQSLLEKE